MINELPCITSSSWPEKYHDRERCEGYLKKRGKYVVKIDIEECCDNLHIGNGGSRPWESQDWTDYMLDAMQAFDFEADHSETKSGFAICYEGPGDEYVDGNKVYYWNGHCGGYRSYGTQSSLEECANVIKNGGEVDSENKDPCDRDYWQWAEFECKCCSQIKPS